MTDRERAISLTERLQFYDQDRLGYLDCMTTEQEQEVAKFEESDLQMIQDLLATVRRETWEEAAKVIENEPELPEEMPLEARIALTDLPLEEQQRAAVRATKKCLAKACRDKARGAA